MTKATKIFLWGFGLVQVLFLVWVIGASVDGGQAAQEYGTKAEREAAEVGTAIGVALVIGFWMVVDVIMGVCYGVWKLATRSK